MNANELKQYIIENDKIFDVLQELECHSIKEYTTEYRCALPDKTNPTAVCIKKDNLHTNIRTSEIDISGDIFALIIELKKVTFGQAVKVLHQILGLKYNGYAKKKENKVDILSVFKKAKAKCYSNVIDCEYYNKSVLRDFWDIPYISWLKEGITPQTIKDFSISYSCEKNRIIIPWRYWCGDETNEFAGIVGRTTVIDYDILGIAKYIGIQPFPKTQNIYGLYENYQTIQEKGYCVVYEAEKSVLKRYSRLDKTGVAVGCHSLSSEQIKILIGLNVDIIIAFDEGVKLKDIWRECEKLYKKRNVYYIYDTSGLIEKGSKDSPADMNNDIFNQLFESKVKYAEKHHDLLKKE